MHRGIVKNQFDQNYVAAIEEIEAHVQNLLHGRVSSLHLRLCGEGIILQGHARTYYAKQIAQQAVMKATEMPILKNDIAVY